MKVKVHNFKWYDNNKNKTSYPEIKRTMEWITNTQGAEAIPGTEEVVDESQLDMHGAYYPPSGDARLRRTPQ